MREYRQRMTTDIREEALSRNRMQQKASRAKWNSARKKKEGEESKLRMRKTRLNRSNTMCTETVAESPSKAFLMPQTFGKAVRKVNDALPRSPRKKAAVVKKLALKFGFMSKNECKKVLGDLEKSIIEFYGSDSVSRQLPGRKDYVVVRNDGKKEKIQKKVLIMTVMEALVVSSNLETRRVSGT